MNIFIGQLIGFVVIALLFWRFVLPPLRRAVRGQQEAIDRQMAESEAAKARRAEAEAAHERARANAKSEADELHRGALKDAEGITEDIRAQADSEVKRIGEHGKVQGELQRANMVRQLRTALGLSAVAGAGALVRSHLSDPAAQSDSIDRVIDELESMSARTSDTVPANAELIGLHSMRATSRAAARSVAQTADSTGSGLDSAELGVASDELTQVIGFLDSKPVLRKKLTDDDDNAAGKETVVRSLFGGKVSRFVVDLLCAAVRQRWSSTADFTAALRRQNALIVLTAAERDGTLEQTEDELFGVARLLEQNPELASLLSDHSHDGDKRVELLHSLVGDKVNGHTWALVSHAIVLLDGQPADVAIDHLAELAAARRGESVAHVVSATELTQAQQSRLASVLGSIYGRQISVQTEIDPSIMGGLRIGVGDEQIKADVATRLTQAESGLPR